MSALDNYLRHMAEKGASDLFFTTGAPPAIKIEGETRPVSRKMLAPGVTRKIIYELMTQEQQREFEQELELNLGFTLEGVGRFRINVYRQRGEVSFVVRYIKPEIPDLAALTLPPALGDLMNEKKGLVLVVGSTGSGKSTTLASMIDHRNRTRTGHILTIEDPIEYTFEHRKSIVGQREVGLDTLSYENALREAMREAPDVIMIGEVRDRPTMESAISYADTGHLCLSTLHSVNAYQALDRVINMFPTEGKNQILMDLSLNLKAIVSQRLVPSVDGRRVPAVEVLVNTAYISELIRRGEINEIPEAMGKSSERGMQTFEQSLFELYKASKVDLQVALDHADSRSDLEWRINFGGGVQSFGKSRETDDLELPSEGKDE